MRTIYFKTITSFILIFNLFGCESMKNKDLAEDTAFVDSLLKQMTID